MTKTGRPKAGGLLFCSCHQSSRIRGRVVGAAGARHGGSGWRQHAAAARRAVWHHLVEKEGQVDGDSFSLEHGGFQERTLFLCPSCFFASYNSKGWRQAFQWISICRDSIPMTMLRYACVFVRSTGGGPKPEIRADFRPNPQNLARDQKSHEDESPRKTELIISMVLIHGLTTSLDLMRRTPRKRPLSSWWSSSWWSWSGWPSHSRNSSRRYRCTAARSRFQHVFFVRLFFCEQMAENGKLTSLPGYL